MADSDPNTNQNGHGLVEGVSSSNRLAPISFRQVVSQQMKEGGLPSSAGNGFQNELREAQQITHDDKSEHGPDQPPSVPFYKRARVMIPLVIVIVLAAIGGTSYWLYARHYEWTDDAFLAGRVVQINPKVAGYVVVLRVDDNQFVNRGDVLVEIDPRDYEAALAQAKAALQAAKDRVLQAEAQVAVSSAAVKSVEADVIATEAVAKNATRILERDLAAQIAVSREELDQAQANSRSALASFKSAQAKVAEARAQAESAKAQQATASADVRQAEAKVRTAELNLSYTKLVAPVSGRVTHRTVEKGDYVQSGQALFALVPPELWVVANYKETQLTLMKVGQPVTIRVDTYPHRELPAHVDSFQRGTGAQFSLLPAENATGNYVKVVQRVPVKIVFDEPLPDDMILGPGMSVVPGVKIR